MFGEVLKGLRNEKKLSIGEFVDNINEKYNVTFSKSMVSRWENELTDPKMEHVRIVADYFNVSLNFLLGLDPSPEWSTNRDKRDFMKMLEEDVPVMFDGVPLTQEDKDKVMLVMQAMFWDAKKRNKRKPIDET